MTRIATRSPSWPAVERDPARRAACPWPAAPAAVSSAWSTPLRIRWIIGSASRSTIVRSSRVSWPTIRSSISLPDRSARSRTTRGNRGEELVDRHHPQVERGVADLPADPLQRLERVDPGRGRGQLAQPLEVVGQDGQLAGQADQVVELPRVHADPGGRPGAPEAVSGSGRAASGLRRLPVPARASAALPAAPSGLGRREPATSGVARGRRSGPERGGRRRSASVGGGGCSRGPVRGLPLDRDRAVLGDEQEDVVEPIGAALGLELDRPDQVAALGVDLVERRDEVGVGRDPSLAQLAKLVEDPQRIDPTPQRVGARLEGDPVDRRPDPASSGRGLSRRLEAQGPSP